MPKAVTLFLLVLRTFPGRILCYINSEPLRLKRTCCKNRACFLISRWYPVEKLQLDREINEFTLLDLVIALWETFRGLNLQRNLLKICSGRFLVRFSSGKRLLIVGKCFCFALIQRHLPQSKLVILACL